MYVCSDNNKNSQKTLRAINCKHRIMIFVSRGIQDTQVGLIFAVKIFDFYSRTSMGWKTMPGSLEKVK